MPDNLILIGPMGAGKSTIGHRLAETLGREFCDSDQVIETRTGACIPWIFEKEGEAGFRAREKAALEDLCARTKLVIATGGGAVLDPDNRRTLRRSGMVIYLTVTLDEQLERVRRDSNRPLLQTADPRATLQMLNQQRDPLYRQTAHHVVHTEGRQFRRVIRRIIELWERFDRTSGNDRVLAPSRRFDHHTGSEAKRPKFR